jgi:hypothetical protein
MFQEAVDPFRTNLSGYSTLTPSVRMDLPVFPLEL